MKEAPIAIETVEQYPFDEALAGLSSAYSTWETTKGEGTRQLWLLLGNIYQLGSAYEANERAKMSLITEVSADPSVSHSSKWIAEKKSGHELLLVKLLGLRPETRSTRSQWHSAIKAANSVGCEPTQTAFVDYLETVGGVEKARQSTVNSRSKTKTFDELVQMFDLIGSGDHPPFRAPTIAGDEVGFGRGYALVLVRGEMAGGNVFPIATIVAPKVIEAAMVRALASDRLR